MTPQEMADLLCQRIYTKVQLIEMISDFGQEIRKDQDKITRHACAENINDLDGYETIEYCLEGAVDRDKAHNIIINTKAI